MFTCRNITGESLMITWTGSPEPPEELRAEPDPPLPAAPKNKQIYAGWHINKWIIKLRSLNIN